VLSNNGRYCWTPPFCRNGDLRQPTGADEGRDAGQNDRWILDNSYRPPFLAASTLVITSCIKTAEKLDNSAVGTENMREVLFWQ